MEIDERLDLILSLADSIAEREDEIIERATRDIGFTYKDVSNELEVTRKRLVMFSKAIKLLEGRSPLCSPDEEVALILPYNGSAWLNIAIASIFLAGNRVRVRFSSRDETIARVYESIYVKVFGDTIKFDHRNGSEFMRYAIESPKVRAIVAFGSDSSFLRYEGAVREAKKKFIFEGPGNDPFIVLDDIADALDDLISSKFMYSGQACIAPERIYVHGDVYDDFLEELVERTESLVVGDTENPETDVAPLASRKAVERIKKQLDDAVSKGARILCGGRIEGDLVYPTVVADADHTMLGMREEIFGPVCYVCRFDEVGEAIALAKDSRYGLRATVYGRNADTVASQLKGADYLEEVEDYTFGKFGTVSVNEPRSESWKGALVIKPIGGYGYSGWVWDLDHRLKQGPKLFSLETSLELI